MLVGLILRHYKIYEGIHFIPVSSSLKNTFSVYIGINGVGKSSIFEAFNVYFNTGKHWNINNGSLASDAYISPVFLIKKTDVTHMTDLEHISHYFWNVEEDKFPKSAKSLSGFYQLRNHLKKSHSEAEYYFFTLGTEHGKPQEAYFSSFDNDLKTQLSSQGINDADLIKLKTKVLHEYNFIYIPVETSVKDVLAIEAKEMQSMMGKEIIAEIDQMLNKKFLETDTETKRSRRKVSDVEHINTMLNDFMKQINSNIEVIDGAYSYKKDGQFKKNLTAIDIRDRIISAYFKIRTLNKADKEIHELSSGEQRVALIDIAYAFLATSRGSNVTKTILAIDEPESSMHTSLCFQQFKRLSDLANNYGKQVMISTHWYGILPMSQTGNLHHIEFQKNPSIKSFELLNIYEQRRTFPDDVELKSFFDLVSSVLSQMKSHQTNWIICEGSDDALYLNSMLKDKISNLTILPVGGIGNVIKIYRYLFGPMSEKSEEKLLQGRVLCLIDTDKEQKTCDFPSQVKSKCLSIKRFQRIDKEVNLVKAFDGGYYHETEFEDCLNPEHFYLAVKTFIDKHGTHKIKEIFSDFEFNHDADYADVNTSLKFLKPKSVAALDSIEDLKFFIQILENKYEIARLYVELNTKPLPWSALIVDYFNN